VQRQHLIRYAWLSIAAALVTIALKSGAYWLTNSVGLLSDALESLVNLAAALLALAMLSIAARPPDDDHAFGHDKAEYFSSGAEGALIMAAAVGIAVAAVHRWMNPQPIEHTSVGLVSASLSVSAR
jgi:cation diffusion facilitator family transporter